jgi:repressor of nif and glnA expression
MTFIRSERKMLEILRLIGESREPIGAKRLSELMAERGFILSDRAVQYYLQYLDELSFTYKVGNRGRLLTEKGRKEAEHALVEERIGYVISKLERLAYRCNFDPSSGSGEVAYNLSIVPGEQVDGVSGAFDEVIRSGLGFYSGYRVIDRDPRVPPGHVGFLTVCSITMDGALQRQGIPVRMAYGGRLQVSNGKAVEFADLIGYRGTTIDPLQLFISAGLTSIQKVVTQQTGIALANVREVPIAARAKVEETIRTMRKSGFVFPVTIGTRVFNLRENPFRLSIVYYSGMNLIGNAIEKGYSIKTEIGAGTIPFDRLKSEG